MRKKFCKRLALLTVLALVCAVCPAAADNGTSAAYSPNAAFVEDQTIDFETEPNENSAYSSSRQYLTLTPRTNGFEVVNDDAGGSIGVVKTLYNTDGDNLTSAVMKISGEIDKQSSHRISWRMKVANSASSTAFYLERTASASSADFEMLAVMGVQNGNVHNPNGSSWGLNDIAYTNKSLNDGGWHTVEAFFYSAGEKKHTDGGNLVELYIDGEKYASFSRELKNALRQIEIYASNSDNTDKSNKAALYIDDIRISRIPTDFYMTADYDGEASEITAVFSLYPDTALSECLNDVTVSGADIQSKSLEGRYIKIKLNSPLESGRRYILSVPDTIGSDGESLKNTSAVFDVPPEQPTDIKITTDKTGAIFTDEDIKSGNLKFNVSFKNGSSQNVTFDYYAEVISEDGTSVYKTSVFAVPGLVSGGCHTTSVVISDSGLSDKSRRYGRFTLRLYAKPRNAETYLSTEKRFTIIRSTGIVNDKVGINTHFGKAAKNDIYGIFDESNNLKKQDLINILDLYNIAGFGVLRDSGLDRGEYSNGFVKDERHETLYGTVRENNGDIIQVMTSGIWSKSGKYMTTGGLVTMPTDTNGRQKLKEEFSAYAKAMPNAHIYELFNEWNLSYMEYDAENNTYNGKTTPIYEMRYGRDTEVGTYTYNIQDFVEMVKAAAEGIRAGDPEAIILAPCSAKDYMPEFLELCFDAGVGAYIDGVAIHPYSVDVMPEIGHKEEGELEEERIPLREKIEQVKAVMTKYGCGGMPVYITELGWSSWVQTPITEDIQADYMIRSLGLCDDLVAEVTFYEGMEHESTSADGREEYYGILYANNGDENALNAKPAYAALSCYNSLTADKQRQNGIETDADGNIYCTYQNSGEKVVMFWNPNSSSDNNTLNIPKDVGDSAAEVLDIYGNVIADSANIEGDADGFSVTSSSRPRYLVIKRSANPKIYVDKFEIRADGVTVSDKVAAADKPNTEFSLKTALYNGFDDDKSVNVIIAAYDGGRLKSVDIKTCEIQAQTEIMSNDMPKIYANGADEVKGFVWLADTLSPIIVTSGK